MENSFKYTVDGGDFTLEQRSFYEENGYIIFRKLIPDKAIDECAERFRKICNDGGGSCYMVKDLSLKRKGNVKGEYLINKIQDFLYDEVFFQQYATNENLIKVVKNITGPDLTACHSMLINKPPDSSVEMSIHPLHQDLHYFPFRPADSLVGTWTAMEKVHKDNGCLFVIPGSHKLRLLPHEYPPNINNKLYHGVQGFDHVPRVNLYMEKGDTVFFHPLILHGSGQNTTKGFRKAISVHFANSNVYYIDVRGTSQEQISSEILEIAKRKSGYDLQLRDFWIMKSRLISGKPGKLQSLSSNL